MASKFRAWGDCYITGTLVPKNRFNETDQQKLEAKEASMERKTGRVVTTPDGRQLDVDREAAMVEKGQQLAGHFPDAEAIERGRRVLEGELTAAEAYAAIDAKYLR